VESGLAAQLLKKQICEPPDRDRGLSGAQIETLLVEAPPLRQDRAAKPSRVRGLKIIRLQCYSGSRRSQALYEWKYPSTLLYTQILKTRREVLGGEQNPRRRWTRHDLGDVFFYKESSAAARLLQAMEQRPGCVLLID